MGVFQNLYPSYAADIWYIALECRLIVVLLLDVVSTNNCVFKNQDSHLLTIVSTGLQLGFVTILLLVHLCISNLTNDLILGGMYISDTPFFTKRHQAFAELASRFGYPAPKFAHGRYMLTTVLQFVFSNLDHPVCSSGNDGQSHLHLGQHFHYVHYSCFNHLLLHFRPLDLPSFHEENVHDDRFMSENFLAKNPFIPANFTKNLDGYIFCAALLFRRYKNESNATNCVLFRS
jgi:hypothetical protein